MNSFVPRGKKFQPRIPREQLLELTTQELQEKGVEHNSQAKLMNEIAHEIYTTDEPIFTQLRGRAFVRNTEAWSRVYSLVINFLRENEMNITIETVETELATARTIKHNRAVDHSNAFDEILQVIPSKPKPFKQRVKEWKAEDEKLNPKPAFVRPTMRDMKQSQNTQHVQLPKKTTQPAKSTQSKTSSLPQKEAKQAPQTQKKEEPTPKTQQKPEQKQEEQPKISKEENQPALEDIPEDDFEVESNSSDAFEVQQSSSSKESEVEEIPTTPIPQKQQQTHQKEPEPEPEPEFDIDSTDDEEDEKPIPLSKQRPTTFAPQQDEVKVTNKKTLLDFDEPEDIPIDFDSDDSNDDFITENSTVANEKSNTTTSQFESFTDETSTVKDEKSKASVQIDSFAKDSFIDDTSTIKAESSKQTFDDFDESSKVDVQQTSHSGSDVEIIEDSSKADVVQQSNSSSFLEIDDDWDA